MSRSSLHIRTSAFLGAAFFSLCSIAVFQQAVLLQGGELDARLIPHVGIVAVSSSSKSSVHTRVHSSSSVRHAAAPVLSHRRRSTGALVIIHSSIAPAVAVKAGCGDGLVIGGEQCDDKNQKNGDGCSAACAVETGFSCSSGQPSTCWSVCGDGVVAATERCDDGNVQNGDGCSAACKDELGFKCTGSPSVCVIPAYCGNGVVETGEACDDGNNHSGDGCFECKTE